MTYPLKHWQIYNKHNERIGWYYLHGEPKEAYEYLTQVLGWSADISIKCGSESYSGVVK